MVQATQPRSSTSEGSRGGSEGVGEERRSRRGMSLTPTEKRVRRRLGSFVRRSDTDGGIVARTLVLYTHVSGEMEVGIPK